MSARTIAALLACLVVLPLGAHDRKAAGPLSVELGWADEPAFSGALNAVVVSLTDRKGPLAKAEGTLSVEVGFGTERTSLALERVPSRPHEFRAAIVPTRAGTYTFRVTGTINTQAIDVTSTCGGTTFHCVEDAAAIQFPVKDPSVGQLAERLDRALPRAGDADTAARRSRTLAYVSLALSGLALIAGALTIVGSRRRRP